MEFNYLNNLPADIEVSERGKYIPILREWENTDSKCLKFACANAEEKSHCASALYVYLRKNHKDYTIFREKGKNNIYVVRA